MSGSDTQTPGFFAAIKSKPLPSSPTAAYCQAHDKLGLPGLKTIPQHTANRLLNTPNPERMNGRRVVVVDGTGISMPVHDSKSASMASTTTSKGRLWFSK